MSQDLFPDATGSPPALKLAREKLEAAELSWAKAWRDYEEDGTPFPAGLQDDTAPLRQEVERLERLELQRVRGDK